MILKFIEKHWKDKSHIVSFLTGVLFTAFSFLISWLLFKRTPHLIGLTTIFFTVILTMPIMTYVLKKEETLEKKKMNFFRKNEAVIDFYLYFFLGTFLVFFILVLVNQNYVFSKDDFYNIKPSTLKVDLPPPQVNDFHMLKSILVNNLYLMVVAFLLSLLFGAGSIFLIVLNSSMAAAAIAGHVVNSTNGNVISSLLCNTSIFSIHFIPEMLGYLVAAIAGGLLFVDFSKEKILSRDFDEVFVDGLKLMGLAVALIIFSGVIEVYSTSKLFLMDVCKDYSILIIQVLVLMYLVLVYLEIRRKRLKKERNKAKKTSHIVKKASKKRVRRKK